MGHVKAPEIPPPHRRYTLHYCNMIKCGPRWDPSYYPRWEKINFKTAREAEEYLAIAGDKAYIIDNVTNKIIKSNNDSKRIDYRTSEQGYE